MNKILNYLLSGFFVYIVVVACSDSPESAPEPDRKPVITILGDNPVTVALNSEYIDAGATASDSEEGDITNRIVVVNSVNTSELGTYTVTYTVENNIGQSATEVRTVNVVNNSAPVITLEGPSIVTVPLGEPYVEFGATAYDAEDGDISANIVIDSSDVNTSVVGNYYVYYNVKDSSGIAAQEVTRDVVVTSTELF